MGDHTKSSLSGSSLANEAEKFSSFLEEIREKYAQEVALGLGDGAIYLAHKSVFENVKLEHIIGMNVSLIEGKGTAEWKLMTPGTVIPQLPVHIHVNENEEQEYNIVRLSPWTVIIHGGEHLGYQKYESLLNYNQGNDDYLLHMCRKISQKTRNNKFRSMCYGQSENICTDPTTLRQDTIDIIFEHAFHFIPKSEQGDYVLYINGSHLMYLLYSMYCTDPESPKLKKHKLLMGPQTFGLDVDNQHLVHGDEVKKIYMCPLFLGTQNIFLGNNYGENLFESSSLSQVNVYSQVFNTHFKYRPESCHDFPCDNFISGMFSSLTMEVIPTPFEIMSTPTDTAKTLFLGRLNFMATQMLRMRGLKAEDVMIQNNDKITAMQIGAVTQLQLSPTAFRCFRESIGKEQLGPNLIKSAWIPNEQSVVLWNLKKYIEQHSDEEITEDEHLEVVAQFANDTTIFNFLSLIDRTHIYNCEMFLNNDEWAGWEKNKNKNIKPAPKVITHDKKKDAIKRRKEKAICEWMRKCGEISYSELVFLRMNCNVFRFKSNVLYSAKYILKNVELMPLSDQNKKDMCNVCEELIFNGASNEFCPCYIFYAACCSITRPGKSLKVSYDDVKKLRCTYNHHLGSEKYGDLSSYKCAHSLPVVDNQGCLASSGNIRLKHSQPDGFKTGRLNTKSDSTIGNNGCDTGKSTTDESEQNIFSQTIQLSSVIKKVDDYLEPLFMERYTVTPQCWQEEAIVSTSRTPMTTSEDINICKLIEDELIKMGNVSPFFISDHSTPQSSDIPVIDIDVKELNDFYEKYGSCSAESIHDSLTQNSSLQGKRKVFKDNNVCEGGDDLFQNTSLPKVMKIDEDFENDCGNFVSSAIYSLLVNKKIDKIFTYEDMKKEVNFTNLTMHQAEFLQKVQSIYGKQGGHKIAQMSCKLMKQLAENSCKTYFNLLSYAVKKTFVSVALALNMFPEQLDDDYDMISVYDNGSSNNKTKIKARNVFDIHTTNSIMRKSTMLSYFGHLRHQLDINVLSDGVYPESKAIESRIVALTQKHSIEAEQGHLYISPTLINIEDDSSGSLPPTMTLTEPVKGIPELNATFISPAFSKLTGELTEPNFTKKIGKSDETENTEKEEEQDDLAGYVPCPLLNSDKMCHGIATRKYDSVNGDELLATLRKQSVHFLSLTSDTFMSSQHHSKAAHYVINYLSKLNCYNHSFNKSILPPLITNIWQDIRRIICQIDLLMALPVYIYDFFAGKRKETKITSSDITSDVTMSVISNILERDKIASGLLHVLCVMTELYGDSIGVSHTPQYNVSLERRSAWIRTLTRGFMRLHVANGNQQRVLKWKSFKSFLPNNGNEGNKNKLITTLHDIIPSHGHYILANMSYTGYPGVEASDTFRNLSFGDPFPNSSIYTFVLDLSKCQSGKQIIVGQQPLFKNWTKIRNKKLDIDTILNQFTMSSFVDDFNNKVISIHDLIDYYQRNQILPSKVAPDMKDKVLADCIDIHAGMIQEDYEKRLYTTCIFPQIWNVLLGKDVTFVSEDEDSEESSI